MNKNFQKDFSSLKYPEKAILMEDVTKENPTGKFIIPVLLPTFNNSKINSKTYPKLATTNLLNKDDIRNIDMTIQNYVELNIPLYLFTEDTIKANSEFIVCFIGGNINNIKILGVY